MGVKKTNRDGFRLVLSHFQIVGSDGGMTAMAKALGVTRAAISVWSKSDAGIPLKHIPKLKALTGLRGRDMLPEVAALMD